MGPIRKSRYAIHSRRKATSGAEDQPLRYLRARHMHGGISRGIKGGVSVSWRMIILLCGRDQCGLNAHSVDPDSMRIESWSMDRPLNYIRMYVITCICFINKKKMKI